mmetsp:Transcript_61851/g.182627  ORF Transcript_61851/g.182627 Transcript_61851/m.182627 type:complete len:280 (+) Transcript_61851:81-920(+)
MSSVILRERHRDILQRRVTTVRFVPRPLPQILHLDGSLPLVPPQVLDRNLPLLGLVPPDHDAVPRPDPIGVLEHPLGLLLLQHNVHLHPLLPQPPRRVDRVPVQVPRHGEDHGLHPRIVERREDVPLLEQLDDDGVSEPESGRGSRLPPERLEEFVVPPPPGDGAELPPSIERLEDGAGVVRQSSDDGGVEGDPIGDPVRVAQFEERPELGDPLGVGGEGGGDVVEGRRRHGRRELLDDLPGEAEVLEIVLDGVDGDLLQFVDEDARRRELLLGHTQLR